MKKNTAKPCKNGCQRRIFRIANMEHLKTRIFHSSHANFCFFRIRYCGVSLYFRSAHREVFPVLPHRQTNSDSGNPPTKRSTGTSIGPRVGTAALRKRRKRKWSCWGSRHNAAALHSGVFDCGIHSGERSNDLGGEWSIRPNSMRLGCS